MKAFLSNYIDISDEEYEAFIGLAKVKIYEKGDFLLSADRPVEKLFFVKSGFMRGYRLRNGVDITHHFYLADWLATDYESYLTGNMGDLFIEALIDTTVYEFKKQTLLTFYESHHKFEKLRFIQAEDAYLRMVKRLQNFQYMALKDRYLELVNKNPELFDLVQQSHIASYLGVTPQSLSRIKQS